LQLLAQAGQVEQEASGVLGELPQVLRAPQGKLLVDQKAGMVEMHLRLDLILEGVVAQLDSSSMQLRPAAEVCARLTPATPSFLPLPAGREEGVAEPWWWGVLPRMLVVEEVPS
jgi:hypothetical protein